MLPTVLLSTVSVSGRLKRQSGPGLWRTQASTGAAFYPLGVMTPRSVSTAPLRLLLGATVEAGIETRLVILLEALGDEATRLEGPQDVRRHIVSCQAHHLAAHVALLVGWPAVDDCRATPRLGIAELTRDLREVLARLPRGRLDRRCASSMDDLLALAQAVGR